MHRIMRFKKRLRQSKNHHSGSNNKNTSCSWRKPKTFGSPSLKATLSIAKRKSKSRRKKRSKSKKNSKKRSKKWQRKSEKSKKRNEPKWRSLKSNRCIRTSSINSIWRW